MRKFISIAEGLKPEHAKPRPEDKCTLCGSANVERLNLKVADGTYNQCHDCERNGEGLEGAGFFKITEALNPAFASVRVPELGEIVLVKSSGPYSSDVPALVVCYGKKNSDMGMFGSICTKEEAEKVCVMFEYEGYYRIVGSSLDVAFDRCVKIGTYPNTRMVESLKRRNDENYNYAIYQSNLEHLYGIIPLKLDEALTPTVLKPQVPRAGDTFLVANDDGIMEPNTTYSNSYRCTGWMKKIEDRYGRKVLQYCAPEEAEYVTGSGVSGVIKDVRLIKITGRVPWSEEQLADADAEARAKIGRTLS